MVEIKICGTSYREVIQDENINKVLKFSWKRNSPDLYVEITDVPCVQGLHSRSSTEIFFQGILVPKQYLDQLALNSFQSNSVDALSKLWAI